jgi:fructoselysine-6-P-deglycase FrlB-like protein
MSFVIEEIASQPACWRRAARLAADPAVRATLPPEGARVAIIGCGTSLFMAQACARLREQAGAGETDAFPASELPHERGYDQVVALTRSGTTTEVLRALERIPETTPSTAVTTGLALPVARLATGTVVLDFADERSVVQTRFATTALALWRAWLGEELEPLAASAERMLAATLPDAALDAKRITFVGSGWGVGIAHEAALKARESAQLWAESYPAMELRHGPISVLDSESCAWIFGEPPAGLVDDVTATGAAVVRSEQDPMVDLVRAQRAAVAIAERRGLDPDAPRNLTRAIVLPGER